MCVCVCVCVYIYIRTECGVVVGDEVSCGVDVVMVPFLQMRHLQTSVGNHTSDVFVNFESLRERTENSVSRDIPVQNILPVGIFSQ